MTGYPPPYRPLRGAEPPHFVDREDPQDVVATGIVAASVAAYAAGACDPRFHRLVVAEPAMGKTALLSAIAREVVRRLGWAVTLHRCRTKERALRAVTVSVTTTLQQQWAANAAALAHEARTSVHRQQELTRKLASISDAGDAPSSWAALRSVLESAGQLGRAISRGLLVMFDDADRLGGGELESLGCLARSLARDGLPVALLFSGGSHLGLRFARAGNFSGCIWPTVVGRLEDGEAREALVVPAADRGVEFQGRALELLCQAARGSPLELQRLGFAAWSAAGGHELITVANARSALDVLTDGREAKAS